MSEIQTYYIKEIESFTASKFVEKWHYSKSTNGIKLYKCFGLYRPTGKFGMPELIGVCIYGEPAMNHQAQKWYPADPSKCIELRRLCCIDDTPKNTESFFISQTIKWLRKNTDMRMIVSYADPHHGHAGIIYKASNFQYHGITQEGISLIVDGKRYHDRTLRMNKPYAKRIKKLYEEGKVEVIKTPGKHIYTFEL